MIDRRFCNWQNFVMPGFLLVPVHLDALVLTHDCAVVEAMNDFSRLPWTDGQVDHNGDTPYVSEAIVSRPFQNRNLHLKAGIHLHWSMPDALTRGIQTDGITRFPAVPNRWLVTRSRTAATATHHDSDVQWEIEGQWVVESDYLYPDGQGREMSHVSYPVAVDAEAGRHRPYRYMGRNLPLEAWRNGASSEAEYLDKLTAIGYGESAFAAFYPNCHSVFGFHDDQVPERDPMGLRYDLLGWYADPGS